MPHQLHDDDDDVSVPEHVVFDGVWKNTGEAGDECALGVMMPVAAGAFAPDDVPVDGSDDDAPNAGGGKDRARAAVVEKDKEDGQLDARVGPRALAQCASRCLPVLHF